MSTEHTAPPAESDDTEGHSFHGAINAEHSEGDDTEGHMQRFIDIEERAVTGHAVGVRSSAGYPVSGRVSDVSETEPDDEDTQGHTFKIGYLDDESGAGAGNVRGWRPSGPTMPKTG